MNKFISIYFFMVFPGLLASESLRFETQEIHQNLAEACAVGDLDKDGDLDIVSGKYYYLNPDWLPVSFRELEEFGKDYLQNNGDHLLDVDGDGRVSLFSDGLMVIRKLLGPSFEGANLTDKARSPSAYLKTDEIHAFIASGVDSGLLDVDRDGRVNPFSDGLLIIRYLMGSSFREKQLTENALSPASPYFGDPDAWSLIASNINSLCPD